MAAAKVIRIARNRAMLHELARYIRAGRVLAVEYTQTRVIVTLRGV